MNNSKPDRPAASVAGKVISSDGTPISFKRFGSGPSLVLVGGAFNDANSPAAGAPLAQLLSAAFTVYAYDRRGRGASGDGPAYAVAREIEDLAAIIAQAGGTAFVHGMSSGAVLALRAAAGGLAISKLSLYEPPFTMDAAAAERAKAYAAALADRLAAGRRGDAAALFMAHVGVPARDGRENARRADVARHRGDGADARLRLGRHGGRDRRRRAGGRCSPGTRRRAWSSSGAPAPHWMQHAGKAVADALPNGRHAVLDGQTHDVSIAALAPVLSDYFAA